MKQPVFFEQYARVFHDAAIRVAPAPPYDQLPPPVQQALIEGVKAIFAELDVRDADTNEAWVNQEITTEIESAADPTAGTPPLFTEAQIDEIALRVINRLNTALSIARDEGQ